MSQQIIECVPNFSEGINMGIINQITSQIETVEGVRLLDVDPGKSTNRTVVTFAGTPDAVISAAFLVIKKASELIDMRKHKGEHPRMGATDVCPLIPVANISMEEVVGYANRLAERVGNELKIPVFLYEHAAKYPKRKNLATIRAGEYEGMEKKLQLAEWKPDFGPDSFNPNSGCTAIGAREFLIAYNVNLNTTSTRRANAIAFDIRERGRVKREDNPLIGPIVKDSDGNPLYLPGTLKGVKAIGWYIDEYKVAQISMNITNINETPLHIAFDETCNKALKRGIRVTGSELVGLVPLNTMLEAGKYFLRKQNRSLGVSEKELIHLAVKSMGLDELKPFDPDKKIIEYNLNRSTTAKLADQSLANFADETASESPAPGGGSIAAYVGTLGISLGTMVANLSSHKRGWDNQWETFSEWAVKGQHYKDMLLKLVDEDTNAFNKIMEAWSLPKSNVEEKMLRKEAIHAATKYAAEVPLQVMKTALASMTVMEAMAKTGLQSSVSDAGVGAICTRSAVYGAYLNVTINLKGFDDTLFVEKTLCTANQLLSEALQKENQILEQVKKTINGEAVTI